MFHGLSTVTKQEEQIFMNLPIMNFFILRLVRPDGAWFRGPIWLPAYGFMPVTSGLNKVLKNLFRLAQCFTLLQFFVFVLKMGLVSRTG